MTKLRLDPDGVGPEFLDAEDFVPQPEGEEACRRGWTVWHHGLRRPPEKTARDGFDFA
jgi:hypothetical protein